MSLALLLLLACASSLEDLTPYVSEPRTIAVRVEPAEAEPDALVSLVTLYADEGGALSEVPVDWHFCNAPRPLAELGPVAASCLDPASADLTAIGVGGEVEAAIPSDTCSVFGPNPPDAAEGEEAGRPVDADVTGGYYQPVVGFTTADTGHDVLVSARIRCGLANVDQDTYVEWNQTYLNNQNPRVSALSLVVDGVSAAVPEDGAGAAPEVSAGEALSLRVTWPDCPELEACDGAETYVVYDLETATLTRRREAISVSWYATAGTFGIARNGVASEDPSAAADNTWTAPDAEGEVWLAVVLRDERGGVGFAGYRVVVGAP